MTRKETDVETQPLRTIMNYQYRYGTSFTVATKTLYEAGGMGRYYSGMGAALIQGRFFLPVVCCISDSHRPRLPLRRHRSERWYTGALSLKLISQKHAIANPDHLRVSMVTVILVQSTRGLTWYVALLHFA